MSYASFNAAARAAKTSARKSSEPHVVVQEDGAYEVYTEMDYGEAFSDYVVAFVDSDGAVIEMDALHDQPLESLTF